MHDPEPKKVAKLEDRLLNEALGDWLDSVYPLGRMSKDYRMSKAVIAPPPQTASLGMAASTVSVADCGRRMVDSTSSAREVEAGPCLRMRQGSNFPKWRRHTFRKNFAQRRQRRAIRSSACPRTGARLRARRRARRRGMRAHF